MLHITRRLSRATLILIFAFSFIFLFEDARSQWSTGTGTVFTTTSTDLVGMGTTPLTLLHLYSLSTNGDQTVFRLQSATNTDGFGKDQIEFWSNSPTSSNLWRPALMYSTDFGGFRGGLAFAVNGSGSSNKTAIVEKMRIVNEGVGINTTTPSEALDVVGNVRFSQALMPNNIAGTAGQILVSQGSSPNPPLWTDPGTIAWLLGGNNITSSTAQWIGTTSGSTDKNFRIKTNSADAMIVNGSGQVGIGTTTPVTGSKLNVTGGDIILTRVNGTSTHKIGIGTSFGPGGFLQDRNTAGNTSLCQQYQTLLMHNAFISNQSTDTYTTTDNCCPALRFGVGTLTPASPAGFGFTFSSHGHTTSACANPNPVTFGENTWDILMTIVGSNDATHYGNVGIGTAATDPANKLEVNKNTGPRALTSGLRLTDLAGWITCGGATNFAGAPGSNGYVLSVNCNGDVIITRDCCHTIDAPIAPPSEDWNQKLEQRDIKIQSLEERVSKLETVIQTMTQKGDILKTQSVSSPNLIEFNQNDPNPFSNSTTISYSLPIEISHANLIVYELTSGKEVQRFDINQTGKGSVIFNAQNLPSGTYTYRIVSDQAQTEFKKMVVVK